MLTPSPPKTSIPFATATADDDMVELKFISELGRSLLVTVHPKKVANRVAEAILNGVDARVSVLVAELNSIGLITCEIGRDGEVENGAFRRDRFEKWLRFMPPQVGYSEMGASEFFINDGEHACEYISPVHINGDIRGAIIVGFETEHEFTDRKTRLIEAATQMAAMSVNLSAHYEIALNDSVTRPVRSTANLPRQCSTHLRLALCR